MKKVTNAIMYISNVILAALFPSLFLFCQNAEEMQFADIAQFAGYSLAFAGVLFVLFLLLFRKPAAAALGASLLTFVLLHYMYVQNVVQGLLPFAKYWHILPFCVIVLFCLFALLNRFCSIATLRDINLVLLLALGAMTLINCISAVPTIIAKEQNKTQTAQTETIAGKPNIYWMTFDECGSFEVLEEHYDFDTTKYRNKLSQMGFAISTNSNNESTDTLTVMTNCVMLDQVVEYETPVVEKNALIQSSTLFDRLNQLGYQKIGIGDTAWIGFDSVTDAAVTMAKTMGGDTAFDLLVERSFLAPIYQKPNDEYAKSILNVFRYLNNTSNIIPNQSTFYKVYVCSPHVPFIFDKYGMAVSSDNHLNWADAKYYLGQYEYIMDQSMIMLDNIIQKDPNAIIIFGSDHGPRGWPSIPTERKSENLLTVYAGGDKQITGTSTIDVLKQVLDCVE